MIVGALRQTTLLLVTLLVSMIYLLFSWLKVRKKNLVKGHECTAQHSSINSSHLTRVVIKAVP